MVIPFRGKVYGISRAGRRVYPVPPSSSRTSHTNFDSDPVLFRRWETGMLPVPIRSVPNSIPGSEVLSLFFSYGFLYPILSNYGRHEFLLQCIACHRQNQWQKTISYRQASYILGIGQIERDTWQTKDKILRKSSKIIIINQNINKLLFIHIFLRIIF